eukprot:SAG11_NODE_3086_length_2703_cov_3.373272_4_plen_65_part_01
MRRVLPALEGCDAVFRYAWYSARNQPPDAAGSGSNLLAALGSGATSAPPRLTSTGEIYRAHALAA